jgi:hypothetical protein
MYNGAVVKLDIASGDILAMICPPGWTPTQIEQYRKLIEEPVGRILPPNVEILMFPYGTQLTIIHPISPKAL